MEPHTSACVTLVQDVVVNEAGCVNHFNDLPESSVLLREVAAAKTMSQRQPHEDIRMH